MNHGGGKVVVEGDKNWIVAYNSLADFNDPSWLNFRTNDGEDKSKSKLRKE